MERYKHELDDQTAVIKRLQEEMKSYKQHATDEFSEVLDPKDQLVSEMMALRVKLVEAEAEKEELLMRVEAAGQDEGHLQECIVGLETMLTVTVSYNSVVFVCVLYIIYIIAIISVIH